MRAAADRDIGRERLQAPEPSTIAAAANDQIVIDHSVPLPCFAIAWRQSAGEETADPIA